MFKVGDRVLIKKPAERHSKMGCCWQPQMDKYNGTVLTVRKAVDMLIEWGLVARRHGSGTYVTKKDVQHETKGLSGFTELMRDQGRLLTSKVLEFRTMPAPPAIASQLRVKVNEPVYFSSRVRSVSGRILLVEESYMRIIPSDATHAGVYQGRYFKLVSITPFKVLRWDGVSWVHSSYTELGRSMFLLRTQKLPSKFRGNI